MNKGEFLVTMVGGSNVCAICHEDEPFIVHLIKNELAEICAKCYALCVRVRQRWIPYVCVECQAEQRRRDDLRQIHDVLSVVDGRYPIKRVCVPCRDDWWERVQDALYGYWPRRIARAIDTVMSLLAVCRAGRKAG